MNHSDILIVGAGQAAMALARGLRDRGYTGSITLLGDEPVAPYERPPLSKIFLTEATPPAPVLFADAAWWATHGVDLRLGERVTRIAPAAKCVQLEGGTTFGYGQLVIATGGRARRTAAGCTLRTAADAAQLSMRLATARSLCVVGGGFLGLEIAASARTRGVDVVVLEAADRLLPGVLPAELGAWVANLHASHGAAVHCGAQVTAMSEPMGAPASVTVDGASIDADVLVAAIGMEPDTRLAEEAGLAVQNGIVVDGLCRTSVADVYAIGDVACVADPLGGRPRRIESWQNAEYQGSVAAAHMAGQPLPTPPVPWFWTEQYGSNIQVLGNLHGGQLAWRGSASDRGFTAVNLLEGRVAGAMTVNAGREVPVLRQLIAMGAEVEPAALASARNLRDLLARGSRAGPGA